MGSIKREPSERMDSFGQVWKYQIFVQDRLLPDLKRALAQKRTLKDQVKDYETLTREIDAITSQSGAQPIVRLEYGTNAYRSAKITDASRIMVNVGKEVYTEFSILEALRFCHEKVFFLRQQIAQLEDRVVEINTHIDLVVANLETLKCTLSQENQ